MFPLIVAGGLGARELLRRRSFKPALALAVVLPALLLGWGTGRLPPALYAEENLYDRPNSVAQLQAATTAIPSDAPVNADAGLTVWLANRHTINDFPEMLDGSSYVVIDQITFLGATTSKAKRQQALDGLAAGGRRVLYDDGRFQVWSPVAD
jgi:hypothetical protein